MSLDRNHNSLVRLTRRRMGQEANLKSPVTPEANCPGELCAVVAGKVIGARLAAAPNCARQDIADQLITDAKSKDKVKSDLLRTQLIQWAKLICEAPVNHELDDCIPKQFEGNDPNVFFDPKVGSVALGSRPETFPRQKQDLYKGPKNATTTPAGTGSDGGKPDTSKMKVVDAKTLPEKCNNPEIQFGAGFPGRPPKELTYMPKGSGYSHGAALNMHIIAEAMCDQMRACLKDAKKDDTEIFTKCKSLADAIGDKKKDGKAADTWNAGMYQQELTSDDCSYSGLTTKYADVKDEK
ncbi:uncharacterized protein MELLADRAFT_105620 [Melampsora larici-populina 98AG31]|uniref:Uncharacterized protein n=1 Tax=Melampsora larici-populina (strain 98AG31 / pathotype 3-4-7) TaxID=747676 RepID=F4RIT8_MELLP|nr:uncharacterized protein MELLADRAFT_105620 [Melampsora larici-populina 98AG31]EGG07621.1 hypothetical protein MELLADRAFT_105620 [Melampsora larici-populina 98AG31]